MRRDARRTPQFGNTPLHVAAFRGDLAIAKQLMERGTADPSRRNKRGRMPHELAHQAPLATQGAARPPLGLPRARCRLVSALAKQALGGTAALGGSPWRQPSAATKTMARVSNRCV